MISPRRSFKIKKNNDDILKRIIKPDRPPIKDPKKSFIFVRFLFKTIETPSNNIKSNIKLTKKT